MPQLMGLVLIGAGIWAGYKAVMGWSERVRAELQRAEDELRRRTANPSEKDLGALELDPETGVYKPASL